MITTLLFYWGSFPNNTVEEDNRKEYDLLMKKKLMYRVLLLSVQVRFSILKNETLINND